ncbi:uncharacterized protein N7511_002107 [Penicillium nucicola]|uniref:uncharacterized protein n=1 Tax=Penicillium nucicola TaxID=1850975 RepID=UPI0025452071|nr:uncharacterized protein N7511_002107 [Penicillium nucicola]KAJ5770056.1 hypothetical protein N7511_002107 [Penicillium nucicola]
MLENALEKLFPSGELDDITRSLLADDSPTGQNSLIQSFIDTNEASLDDSLEPDARTLDNTFVDSQSLSVVNTDYDLLGLGSEGQTISLEYFPDKDELFNHGVEPLLLRWVQQTHIYKDSALPTEEHTAEAQCNAAGLAIARDTIDYIAESIVEGSYDKMTLAFTLYVVFCSPLLTPVNIDGSP